MLFVEKKRLNRGIYGNYYVAISHEVIKHSLILARRKPHSE
jgi:hypothetical protein